MSLTHFFTFFLLFAVIESVFGATCKNSTTCFSTTYTIGTCDATTQICNCKSGAAPIPSGCGLKLSTPTLSLPAGYSTVVLDGKTATLTCNSPDGATLFEWTLNDANIASATTSTYTTAAITASANLGPYKCKAKVSGMSSLDSDQSNAITFVVLAKTATTITIPPSISLPTTTSFVGKSVPISCTNVPIGYDSTKVVIMGESDSPVPSPVTMSETNKGAPVKCELTDNPASHANKLTGSTTNLPTLVTDIAGPITIHTTAVNNGVYTNDAPITLKCVTTPDAAYVDTTAKPITWAWMKDATVISGANTQNYDIPTTDGSYTIKCQVTTTTTTTPIVSLPITIVRNSNYITKPNITANPTTPVLGSRLTLTCGSIDDTVGYSWTWKKDNTDIARQFEQIIQLDNLTTSDNGAYVCTARKSQVTQISDAFTVKVGVSRVPFNRRRRHPPVSKDDGGQEVVKVSMILLGLTLLMSKVFA